MLIGMRSLPTNLTQEKHQNIVPKTIKNKRQTKRVQETAKSDATRQKTKISYKNKTQRNATIQKNKKQKGKTNKTRHKKIPKQNTQKIGW